MSGNKTLLDTNVLIFASKGQIDVQQLLQKYEFFYVSIITFMEVYSYDFQNEAEKQLIDELFEALEVVNINRPIAEQTIIYRTNKVKKSNCRMQSFWLLLNGLVQTWLPTTGMTSGALMVK